MASNDPNPASSQALATPYRPSQFLRFPDELIRQVLTSPGIDAPTLRAVSRLNHRLFEQASALLWQDAKITNNLVDKLRRMTAPRRRLYGALVKRFTFEISMNVPPGHLAALRMPNLLNLRIQHERIHGANAQAELAGLIAPTLQQLFIAGGDTENLLPAISRTLSLRLLNLNANMVTANSAHLVEMLNCCTSLRSLHLGPNTSALLDAHTFASLAALPHLTHLLVAKPITLALVRSAIPLPAPFRELRTLRLTIAADAAILLLPKLSNIQSLLLDLSGSHTVFSALTACARLHTLRLNFSTNYVLTQADLNALANLSSIRILHLRGPHPTNLITSSLIPAAFGSCFLFIPQLENFAMEPSQTWGVDLLWQVGHARPTVKQLELTGRFDLLRLEAVTPPLFPTLKDLTVGAFQDDVSMGGSM